MRTSAIVALALIAGSARAHEGTPSEFNYRDDVRPIFVEHCAGCHRPGGVGPMSLLSYSDAVPWANAVKIQVLEAQMPPWLPADGVGAFEHTRSLSADEINIVIDWVIGQTPEGAPMTADELVWDASDAWAMGEPDIVLAPDQAVVIGEDDYELTECIVLSMPTREPVTVTGFELKPGAPTLVRRATIWRGDTCSDAQPLITWLPGQGSAGLGTVHGQRFPAGATLAVEILYIKGWEDEGKRITDRSELGLKLSTTAAPVQTIRIVDAGHTFARDVEIIALYPEGDAPVRVLLSGSDPVLVIEELRAQWREKYVLSTPVRVPAGVALEVSQAAVWVDFIDVSAVSGQ